METALYALVGGVLMLLFLAARAGWLSKRDITPMERYMLAQIKLNKGLDKLAKAMHKTGKAIQKALEKEENA